MRPFTLATLVILLATLAISPANAAGSTVVVSGFASVPATTTGATEVHVAGIKGMTLIDVCTGTAHGGPRAPTTCAHPSAPAVTNALGSASV